MHGNYCGLFEQGLSRTRQESAQGVKQSGDWRYIGVGMCVAGCFVELGILGGSVVW